MVTQIRTLISDHGEGALEAHDVRTRHAGQATFIRKTLDLVRAIRICQPSITSKSNWISTGITYRFTSSMLISAVG